MALQFRFQITEDDNGSADGSIVWPVALGSITLGYSAGKNKARLSERTVALAENFSDLLKIDCLDHDYAADSTRARIYPITGNIGMGELIDQFLIVNGAVGLAKRDKDTKDKKIFNEKLQFTTILKGGVKPSLVLSPSTGHTIKFNGDFNADRSDIHEVIVDILPGAEPAERPPEPKVAATKHDIDNMPEMRVRVVPDPDDEWRTSITGPIRRSSAE